MNPIDDHLSCSKLSCQTDDRVNNRETTSGKTYILIAALNPPTP